jgi:serine/threonine protein kinase
MQEVDIWSFGCFIFEMLTLHRPYQGLPDSEIYDLIKVRPLPQKQALAFVVASGFK